MLTKPMEDLMGPKSIGISLEGVVDQTEICPVSGVMVSLCALPGRQLASSAGAAA